MSCKTLWHLRRRKGPANADASAGDVAVLTGAPWLPRGFYVVCMRFDDECRRWKVGEQQFDSLVGLKDVRVLTAPNKSAQGGLAR